MLNGIASGKTNAAAPSSKTTRSGVVILERSTKDRIVLVSRRCKPAHRSMSHCVPRPPGLGNTRHHHPEAPLMQFGTTSVGAHPCQVRSGGEYDVPVFLPGFHPGRQEGRCECLVSLSSSVLSS